MNDTYKIKDEIKAAIQSEPEGFLAVMLKDPQEAIRWAAGVARHPELSDWGRAVMSAVEFNGESPACWTALDGARLSFLSAKSVKPAKAWATEGGRGVKMMFAAASKLNDYGVEPLEAQWLLKTLKEAPGYSDWKSRLSSTEALAELRGMTRSGKPVLPFQELLADKLSPSEAWVYLRTAIQTRLPVSKEAARVAGEIAFSSPDLLEQAIHQVFFRGFGNLSDAGQAGLTQALSEAAIPEGKDFFCARISKTLVEAAWSALTREDFECGVEFARWAAKLGGAGRWASQSQLMAGGGKRPNRRRVQVASLEGSIPFGGVAFGGLQFEIANLAGVALAMQNEKALRELMALGWALPKKKEVLRLAAETREFARINALSKGKCQMRWIGDSREGEGPALEDAANAMMALWERIQLEREHGLCSAPASSSKQRRPGL